MKITSLKELRSLETGGYKFAGTFDDKDLMDFVRMKNQLAAGDMPEMNPGGDRALVREPWEDEKANLIHTFETILEQLKSGSTGMLSASHIVSHPAPVDQQGVERDAIGEDGPGEITVDIPACEGCEREATLREACETALKSEAAETTDKGEIS